jgi:hypothetical protein
MHRLCQVRVAILCHSPRLLGDRAVLRLWVSHHDTLLRVIVGAGFRSRDAGCSLARMQAVSRARQDLNQTPARACTSRAWPRAGRYWTIHDLPFYILIYVYRRASMGEAWVCGGLKTSFSFYDATGDKQ